MVCPSCGNSDTNITRTAGKDGDKLVWYCVLYCTTCGDVLRKWTESRG